MSDKIQFECPLQGAYRLLRHRWSSVSVALQSFRRTPDRQSKLVMESLIDSLSPLPAEACRSITFDRGTEFSAWQHLKDGLGVEPWFCDPQSPWQKGTVENINNRLRRYLPRKADPTAFTNRYLRSICDRLTQHRESVWGIKHRPKSSAQN